MFKIVLTKNVTEELSAKTELLENLDLLSSIDLKEIINFLCFQVEQMDQSDVITNI